MYEKYVDDEITKIWLDSHKLKLWQKSELAVIRAREELGRIKKGIFFEIRQNLINNPIDLKIWKLIEKERNHDLEAFIEERLRFLPLKLQEEFHKHMTSFDTEEPAFARMLKDSLALILGYFRKLEATLGKMARKYRYTIMDARTHGQEAEIQSFGKRCLTWLRQLRESIDTLEKAAEKLKYSKMSGAIGGYGSFDPELEERALSILGFVPFYGATQIMPRELYAPIAGGLCQIVLTLDKIATDIRLGARSGRPIYQESFGKKQRGSSKMPHKRNTISSERIEGMARMAEGYFIMIMRNIKTWEERAIEQSSVERVAWPDLLHVTAYALKLMDKIIGGLEVYPDNMMLEIIETRGCYASGEAKETLKEILVQYGIGYNDAYSIVQLAAFTVFKPGEEGASVREFSSGSLDEADSLLAGFKELPRPKPISIQQLIPEGKLEVSPINDATPEQVNSWNSILIQAFQKEENIERWNQIFQPSYLLRNEGKLYAEILGC